MKLICAYEQCGKEFDRPDHVVRVQKSQGQKKFYCHYNCAQMANKKISFGRGKDIW